MPNVLIMNSFFSPLIEIQLSFIQGQSWTRSARIKRRSQRIKQTIPVRRRAILQIMTLASRDPRCDWDGP